MRICKWNTTLTKWYLRHYVYGMLPISVQNALVRRHGRRSHALRYGEGYEEMLRLLETYERSTPDEVRAYQDTKLREIIRHAYDTVPYYRDVMEERNLKPDDFKTSADLEKLPVIGKEDVRAAGTRMISSAFRKSELQCATTSASTGTPLAVYWDPTISVVNHACYMRMRRWTGVPEGAPIAIMQGKPTVPPTQKRPPFWRYNTAWNQLRLSTLHMSDANLPYYMDELRRFGARSLETYPAAAYILARFLESRDDRLKLDSVVTTGEPLFPLQRKVIEDRFQTRVFDAYGQAERVIFSSECEEHSGHHIYDEYGITEVVDSDGARGPDGCTGLLVGTSLHNRAMPLIRYACGDVGALSGKRCACGRSLTMMEGLASRANDVVVLPDGRMLAGRNVGWSVRMIEHVKDWQVVQERIDLIRMIVVTDRPVLDAERAGVKEYFRRRLGPEVEIRVERVPEITKSPIGKARHVISRVPLVWGQANVMCAEEWDDPSSPDTV